MMLPKSRYTLPGSGGGGGGGSAGPINLASLGIAATSDPTSTLVGSPIVDATSIEVELAAGAAQDPEDGVTFFFDLSQDSFGQAWPSPFTNEQLALFATRLQPGTGSDLAAVVGLGIGVIIGVATGPTNPTTIQTNEFRSAGYIRDDNRAASVRGTGSNSFVSTSPNISSGTFPEAQSSTAVGLQGSSNNTYYTESTLLGTPTSEIRNTSTSGNTNLGAYVRPCITFWRTSVLAAPATAHITPLLNIATQLPVP